MDSDYHPFQLLCGVAVETHHSQVVDLLEVPGYCNFV